MPGQSENSASTISIDNIGSKAKDHYRIVVMGSAKVGKTAIINQFLYDTFDPKYKETVEELHRGEYDIAGVPLVLDILDTSGAYEFPAMRALSIANADAFILVYSIEDAESFEEVRRIREVILQAKEDKVPIVVVGNKSDLTDGRKVSKEAAETIVSIDWEHGFIESSAKESDTVMQVFKELLTQASVIVGLSPRIRRRRQSCPPAGHLTHIVTARRLAKRHSCTIS